MSGNDIFLFGTGPSEAVIPNKYPRCVEVNNIMLHKKDASPHSKHRYRLNKRTRPTLAEKKTTSLSANICGTWLIITTENKRDDGSSNWVDRIAAKRNRVTRVPNRYQYHETVIRRQLSENSASFDRRLGWILPTTRFSCTENHYHFCAPGTITSSLSVGLDMSQ